jgi:hypothetical protein
LRLRVAAAIKARVAVIPGSGTTSGKSDLLSTDSGDAGAIAARGLGSVEGHISMVEELLNITLGEVGGKGEAQTDTNSELRRRQDGLGKNGLAKIFGASCGADWVALIQHHQEFLTAVAANHVVGADGSAQPAGSFAKNIVAGGVTEGVVDGVLEQKAQSGFSSAHSLQNCSVRADSTEPREAQVSL